MEETKTRRVVFSFDDRSYEDLSKIAKQGRFNSMERCRCSQHQPTGTEEITVTNPETGQQRILLVPTFEPRD